MSQSKSTSLTKAPDYPRLLLDRRAIQFQSAQTSKKHAHWRNVTTLKKGQRVEQTLTESVSL